MEPAATVPETIPTLRHCGSCGLQERCLPAGLAGDALARLDATIKG